ncbi:MAG TPA: TatD family hydrolase [Candidatus Omnitrophota bacterium]|nr:TatD family hydrolase [Candidatus Omnitrophota bacterium]HPT07346.1 TatD family hydrolase [Candidatus Omnitrophota bacterium]
MNAELIDTHAHIDYPDYDQDRDEMIGRALDAGIAYIINVGPTLEGSRNSVKLAAQYPGVFAAVGIHPHDADNLPPGYADSITGLCAQKKVVAVGEIGLDYCKNFSKPENQRELFRALLSVAKKVDLPVVLHSRQADHDTIRIIKEFMPIRAVVHCFSSDIGFLHDCLGLGFMVSFTCNVTYKKSEHVRQVVREAPLERVMLETDSPYLPAEGYRGKRNEPFFVRHLAEYVAALRGIPFEEVCRVTTENAKRFFHLP